MKMETGWSSGNRRMEITLFDVRRSNSPPLPELKAKTDFASGFPMGTNKKAMKWVPQVS